MQTITSRQNERVKRVVALAGDAAARDAEGQCVLYGAKLCLEAARQGAALRELWLHGSAASALSKLAEAAGEVFLMSGGVRDKLSVLHSTQDVVAVADIPPRADVGDLAENARLVLLCDVQDPANVGAILRSGMAFGYAGALLAGGCADAWSPKSLRAGMGAQFVVGVASGLDAVQVIGTLRQAGHFALATSLRPSARDIRDIAPAKRMTLVVGNEGAGLPDEVVAVCDEAAVIPITDETESLNVTAACAIAMWMFADGR